MIEAPEPQQLLEISTKRTKGSRLRWWLIGIVVFIGALIGAALYWYRYSLQPVSAGSTTSVRLEVPQGSAVSQIGQLLHDKGLIRSPVVFDLYTRLHRSGSVLQAGMYNLSPSQSVQEIIAHLSAGKADHFSITFYPGATLTDKSSTPMNKRTDVTSVLLRAGYSQAEIDAAFSKQYTSPLFDGRPAGASLEGYVYGETYDVYANSTVDQILEKTFDEYYRQIQRHGLVDAFKARGLTLYQGITLASIVQREVSNPADEPKVAQVFLLRLKTGMPLGSDVTYQYAARQMGVAPTPLLDSPYNTRKVTGLPPGPIAVPGLAALRAVATPATTDYIYFLSGDDDVTYFAHTEAEHQDNIVKHCTIKCSTY